MRLVSLRQWTIAAGMTSSSESTYGRVVTWTPERPKFHPLRLLVAWLAAAASLLVAAWLIPGAHVNGFWGALAATAAIAALNAILPPLVAALRLPFMLLFGLVLVLVLDALILLAADGGSRYAFGDRLQWYVLLYADIGAGDSQLTWQAAAGLGYAFGWGDVVGLWRYLRYDFKSDQAIQDLAFNGPMIGVTFRW